MVLLTSAKAIAALSLGQHLTTAGDRKQLDSRAHRNDDSQATSFTDVSGPH